MKRKLVSFDWAIKRILRSKANFGILEGFLSELLFEDIHILEVLESESNQNNQHDKFNRLDIKVRDKNENIVLIEIQYSSELDYLQRILYASSKAITEHLKESDAYSNISKIISINILYFDFGDGEDYIYKGTTSFVGLHDNSKLQLNPKQQQLYKATTIEKIYPEYYLIKVRNFDDIAKNSLDEWIYFLKNEEIKDKFNAKGLKKAKETLDYLKMSDQERQEYEWHQTDLHHQASIYESTYVLGEMQGIKKGIAQGIEQQKKKSELYAKKEKTKIIHKLAKKGLDLNDIAEISEASLEEIKDILGK